MPTTRSWPTTTALRPRACAAGIRKVAARFRSPFNGAPQALGFNAERLMLSLSFTPLLRSGAAAGELEALLNELAGGDVWVNAWHFGREAPVGTMRGSPTLSAGAARGDATLAITGGTASSTLLPGDMLGCGGWLFQVKTAVTLNGSGAGTVALVNRVRATIAGSTAVTWNKPTMTFATPSDFNPVNHIPAVIEGATLELEEVWTP